MNITDDIVKLLANAIRQKEKKETQPYDTVAKVVRVEGSTAWVHIPGGVDETPVAMTINALPGDTVRVRVSGGSAWIMGSDTAPPTDDRMAIIATETAQEAKTEAKEAKIAVVNLDDSLTQAEVFDRLTNGGTTQGIYLEDGKIYINGEYIRGTKISGVEIETAWDTISAADPTTGDLYDYYVRYFLDNSGLNFEFNDEHLERSGTGNLVSAHLHKESWLSPDGGMIVWVPHAYSYHYQVEELRTNFISGYIKNWANNAVTKSNDLHFNAESHEFSINGYDVLTVVDDGILLSDQYRRIGYTQIELKTGSAAATAASSYIRAYPDSNLSSNGNNMLIQSGGALIIGSGEFPINAYNDDLDGCAESNEALYIGSDGVINIYTNAGSKAFRFNTNGNFVLLDGLVYSDSESYTAGGTTAAAGSGLICRDSADVTVAQCRSRFETDGRSGVRLEGANAGVYNSLTLYVDSNGNRTVYVNAADAWRDALDVAQDTYGMDPPTVYSGVTATLQRDGSCRTGGHISIALQYSVSSIGSGSKVLCTLPSGFRPTGTVPAIAFVSGNARNCEIAANGRITISFASAITAATQVRIIATYQQGA